MLAAVNVRESVAASAMAGSMHSLLQLRARTQFEFLGVQQGERFLIIAQAGCLLTLSHAFGHRASSQPIQTSPAVRCLGSLIAFLIRFEDKFQMGVDLDKWIAKVGMKNDDSLSSLTLSEVHGGLSPDIVTLDQMRLIDRNQEIPHEGAFCGDSSCQHAFV
eukprot:767953-Hanusia_phi.AAC.5